MMMHGAFLSRSYLHTAAAAAALTLGMAVFQTCTAT
jgi:hypothetical protein